MGADIRIRLTKAPAFRNDGTNWVLHVDQPLVPKVTDGASLGTLLLNWSDLFLDSGAVINFDGGDVTLTHAANEFTLGGGDFRVADGFGFILGHTAQITAGNTAEFQVLGTGGPDSAEIVARFSNNASAPSRKYVKSRDPVIADGTFAIVQDGDSLGVDTYYADDGTNFESSAANTQAQIDGTPGENDVPGRYIIGTTADGNPSPSERLRIDSKGNVIVGGTASGGAGSSNALILLNGDAEDTQTANSSALFARDVTSSSELWAADESEAEVNLTA